MTLSELETVCTYDRSELVCFKNKGKNAIFSNFYPFTFTVDGVTFHSVEQFYHWRRLQGTPRFQEKILTYTDEKNAWRCFNYTRNRGVAAVIEKDLSKRIEYMREALRLKLTHCEGFREALMATGNRPIAEINQTSKPDDIWAVNVSREAASGSNILGKLLMELRQSL